MSFLNSLKRRVSGAPAPSTPTQPAARQAPEPEAEPPVVAEIEPADLIALRQNDPTLVVLDCREGYERKQGRIPGSLHIPMNDTPQRLGELDPDAKVVVVCAHGNRSYAVTGFLAQRGFQAINLRGGMASWQARGGEVERG